MRWLRCRELPGEHQGTVRAQHPPQLAQGCHPVIDVIDREGQQHQVNGAVGDPADQVRPVVHAEVVPLRRQVPGSSGIALFRATPE